MAILLNGKPTGKNIYQKYLQQVKLFLDSLDGDFEYQTEPNGKDNERECTRYRLSVRHSKGSIMSDVRNKLDRRNIKYLLNGSNQIVVTPKVSTMFHFKDVIEDVEEVSTSSQTEENIETSEEEKLEPVVISVKKEETLLVEAKVETPPKAKVVKEPKKEKATSPIPVVAVEKTKVTIEDEEDVVEYGNLEEEEEFVNSLLSEEDFAIKGKKVKKRTGKVEDGILDYHCYNRYAKKLCELLISGGYEEKQVVLGQTKQGIDTTIVTLYMYFRPGGEYDSPQEVGSTTISDEEILELIKSRPKLQVKIIDQLVFKK